MTTPPLPRRRLVLAACALASLACLSGAPASGGSLEYRLVALEGDPAPGTPAGVRFGSLGPYDPAFRTVMLGGPGQVGFVGTLVGASDVGWKGVWGPDASGGLALAARAGDPAAGLGPGVVYGTGFSPVMNPSGAMGIWGTLDGAGVTLENSRAVWFRDPAGSMRLVARAGDAAPGTEPGTVFRSLNRPSLGPSGGIALSTVLRGPEVTSGNDRAIWYDDPAVGTVLVARTGDPAPGMAAGTTFSGFYSRPTLAAEGRLAFVASTTWPDQGEGVWSWSPTGGLSLVLRTGDPAPGTSAGETFTWFYPLYSPGGVLGVYAGLQGPDVTADNDEGAWIGEDAGSFRLLLRKGDPAPGLAEGVTISWVDTPVPNDAGQAAVRAGISQGPEIDDAALWLADSDGSLRLIAHEDDTVANESEGLVFAFFWPPVLNDRGEVYFAADLRDPEGDPWGISSFGLFFADAAGNLYPVAPRGEELEVAPGDRRTILVAGWRDEDVSRLNDASEVAFDVVFEDGSEAVYLATFIPDPEIDIRPGSRANIVAPFGWGVIPVALLGSDRFDVHEVDVDSLAFGPAGAPLVSWWGPWFVDLNGDGFTDLLGHFRTAETGIAVGDVQACLVGETLEGRFFQGCDAVRTGPFCGIGAELALLLPPLFWLHRRRRRG